MARAKKDPVAKFINALNDAGDEMTLLTDIVVSSRMHRMPQRMLPHVFLTLLVSPVLLDEAQRDAVKRRLQPLIDKMQAILDKLAEKK